MSSPVLKPTVLIVGAGELGASTAVSLLRSGQYGKVTIIDRAETLPALDAASCDINKVVRFDYIDKDYAVLAKKAIDEWNKPDWYGIYYQSGVVVRGLHLEGYHGETGIQTYQNVKAQEPKARLLNTPEEFTRVLSGGSPSVKVRIPGKEVRGYYNPSGGWANATAAVEKLYSWIRELGGEIIPKAEFQDLLYSGSSPSSSSSSSTTPGGKKDVIGVRVKDGREFKADKVVLALGSWSGSHPSLKGIIPENLVTATGQTVCAIQLSKEQAERYKDIPVSMHHDGSGYYSFPPNEQGIVKFALHAAGYVTQDGVPRTATDPKAVAYTNSQAVGWIPKDSYTKLREQLSIVYPELAQMPIAFTRMCWYSDVVDGNWVIDISPDYPSLTIATGGAGHAFKFLPIIGDLIKSRMEGTLEPHLQRKWRITRDSSFVDPARKDMIRRPLKLHELVTEQELLTGLSSSDEAKRASRL